MPGGKLWFSQGHGPIALQALTARGPPAASWPISSAGSDLSVSHYSAGFTISFSGRIPVIGGNGIPFRNFGEFRRISVDFGRNLLNFEF